jgi:hypothetical protein
METIRYVAELCARPNDTVPWSQDELPPSGESHSYHAEQAGLGIINTEDILVSIEHATSVEDIVAAFDTFTQEFGARTSMAANWYPKGDLEAGTQLLKHRMKSLIEKISVVPKELLVLSGIESIHFTEMMSPLKTTKGQVVGTASGQANIDEGRIELSLDRIMADFNYIKTALHEVGHVLDGKLCGGKGAAESDTAFLRLNRPPFEYDFDRAVQSIVAEGQVSTEVFGVARTYGLRGPLEDKATFFEEMLAGVNFGLANSNDMIVRDKYHFLLARLEEAIPNIAPYLVSVALSGSSADTRA